MKPKVTRDKLLSRWEGLRKEREDWREHWKDIQDYILPRTGKFFVTDTNDGDRRNDRIYDSSGTRALRVLGAGMMAGATSPARPWFKLKTEDNELNEFHTVKLWLDDVTKLMSSVFSKSNTYRALHTMYEELAGYGTAASILLPDYNNVIHHYVLTAGEYCAATNSKGEVDTLYREFQMTVAQLVKEFGYDNCSISTQNMYDTGSLDEWITVIHAIEPRTDRETSSPTNKNMPWGSYHFELGASDDKFLRESGFEYFPALVPRWSVSGGDVYGTSPGMEALGDVRQLQHEQLRKAQAIDYQTKPPLAIPSTLKNREVDTLPGGITYYDSHAGSSPIQSMWNVNLNLQFLLEDINDVRGRINGTFYADLFMMLANATDTRMTATEVAERHEEKLLMLGPVLERLHTEMLSPLIENTFSAMMRAQIVPPPPPEMAGVEIDVEFVSMLAQAQRAVGVNSVDRWMGNIGAVAQYKPEVLDKINVDYWVESYADMLGLDPELIVPEEVVMAMRQQRAEQAEQAEQAAIAEQQSKTVNNLAGASMGPDNVLSNVLDQFSGYNTPGVVE